MRNIALDPIDRKEYYNHRVEIKNLKCDICFNELSGIASKFVVDHCHHNGKIRGLLCRKCNMLLGFVCDDEEILYSAISYLKSEDNP